MNKAGKQIRIILVDDHQIIRDGISSLLRDVEDIQIVGEAGSGTEAIEVLKSKSVDIVLMDISMSEMNGIDATKIISRDFKAVKVIALSMHNEDSFIIKMLQVGAVGYVLKTTDKKELTEAVRTVHSGENYFTKEASKAIMQHFMRGKAVLDKQNIFVELTKREEEVLKLITKEYTNQEIANMLFLSPRTIDTHRANLLHKLKVKNTAGLVKYAVQHNLI